MDNFNGSLGLSLSQNHLSQSHLDPTINEQKLAEDGVFPKHSTPDSAKMPKLMLLTVVSPPKRPCEQRVSVDDLAPHLAAPGVEILIPPFVVGDFLEVVFVRKHGMVFEYMRYLKDGWFGN